MTSTLGLPPQATRQPLKQHTQPSNHPDAQPRFSGKTISFGAAVQSDHIYFGGPKDSKNPLYQKEDGTTGKNIKTDIFKRLQKQIGDFPSDYLVRLSEQIEKDYIANPKRYSENPWKAQVNQKIASQNRQLNNQVLNELKVLPHGDLVNQFMQWWNKPAKVKHSEAKQKLIQKEISPAVETFLLEKVNPEANALPKHQQTVENYIRNLAFELSKKAPSTTSRLNTPEQIEAAKKEALQAAEAKLNSMLTTLRNRKWLQPAPANTEEATTATPSQPKLTPEQQKLKTIREALIQALPAQTHQMLFQSKQLATLLPKTLFDQLKSENGGVAPSNSRSAHARVRQALHDLFDAQAEAIAKDSQIANTPNNRLDLHIEDFIQKNIRPKRAPKAQPGFLEKVWKSSLKMGQQATAKTTQFGKDALNHPQETASKAFSSAKKTTVNLWGSFKEKSGINWLFGGAKPAAEKPDVEKTGDTQPAAETPQVDDVKATDTTNTTPSESEKATTETSQERNNVWKDYPVTKAVLGTAALAGGIALKMTVIGLAPGIIVSLAGLGLLGWAAGIWYKRHQQTKQAENKPSDSAPASS